MLSRFDRDGIELVIDNETGEAFATQAGYCRMANANKSTVSMRFKGVQSGELKTAEIQTPGGLQGVQLIPAKLVFKWALKDNPNLAEAMGECGATVYLYRMAGYQVKAVEPPKSQLDILADAIAILQKQEKEIEALKALQADNERRLDGVEAEVERLNYPMGRYFTIMGYANLIGKKIQLTEAATLGTKASKVCKGLSILPEKVKDRRFGMVNSYPEEILQELMGTAR